MIVLARETSVPQQRYKSDRSEYGMRKLDTEAIWAGVVLALFAISAIAYIIYIYILVNDSQNTVCAIITSIFGFAFVASLRSWALRRKRST